jgi:hypothetical protein
MLDLFQQVPKDQQISDFKTELKNWAKRQGHRKGPTKLFYGDVSNIENCVLLIIDPPTHKYFESLKDKEPLPLLENLEISHYLITYNYLIYKTLITTKDIKQFSSFIQRLTDILAPKIIVCLGEQSQFCYFKTKFLLEEYAGKQIGEYSNIPIFTTHNIEYYSHSKVMEDHTYKDQIKQDDWRNIKITYEEKIQKETIHI